MNVAIIGTGPAGLIAAHAAQMGGADQVILYGDPEPETLQGAQWLRQPIPFVAEVPSVAIRVEFLGAKDGQAYDEKVAGPDTEDDLASYDWPGLCAQAYDLRTTYRALFAFYREAISGIVAWDINAESVRNLLDHVPADLWINSVDGRRVCDSGCTFAAVDVWRSFYEDAGIFRGRVRISAEDQTSWHRDVSLFGRTLEWPAHAGPASRPPYGAPERHARPMWTNCACNRDVLRVGRAAWNVAAGMDDVYARVQRAVAGDERWRLEIPHMNPDCPFHSTSRVTADTAAQLGCRCEIGR